MVTQIKYGVNLNAHPEALSGRPTDVQDLRSLSWVRMVFFFHAAVQGNNPNVNLFGYDITHPLDYQEALEKAFAHYDPLVASYAQVGVQTLLVLNQESFAGNAPWLPASDGDWNAFATNFAEFAGHIAAHYQGKDVAYEIWNEGDVKPHPGTASVFIEPEKFALVLNRVAEKIREQAPDSLTVLGGLATGAGAAIQYVKTIRDTLGGNLPVDVIGIHPYGQIPPSGEPDIPTGWFGRLDEDTLSLWTQELPNQKFWITEIGVSEPTPIPQEFYLAIADYMQEVCSLVQIKYSDAVPAIIWFAWSDTMRNAGIVDVNSERKQPIYNRFFQIVNTPIFIPVPPPRTPTDLFVTPTTELNVREGPSTEHDIITTVRVGDRLEVLENDLVAARAKLGRRGEWIHIRTPGGIDGFSAAWFLTEIIVPPVSIPTDPTSGQQRALDFQHQPQFLDLPVMMSPSDVAWFNGFGPNNFSYHQSKQPDGGVYKRLFGLHNGLDFGVPHGTPLQSVDWGLVVHTSSQLNDTPFGAKPFTIAILYGKYLCLYGHISDSISVNVGDIVAPRQQLGLSGTDPNDGPHLHFETRELRASFLEELKTQVQTNGLASISQWFDPARARRNVRVYANPAQFFTVSLETHNWSTGFHLPNLDLDNNGYPDHVILAGDMQPTAFDLNWMPSYPPKQGNFWDSSREV